ncbi:MAG: DUF423 domain-containing protein [Porticoccaceae bacterium]
MKSIAIFTGLSGFLAVALGAFGAHGLRGSVAPEMLAVWQTAVLYQMFHALVLLAIVIAGTRQPLPLLQKAAWSMMAGTVLFSGSLYVLVLSGVKALGMVTPLGGVLFMLGWLLLSVALVQWVAQQSQGD